MKKYLFGMIAVVLAIGFSAFTKPVKTEDFYLFRYDGSITTNHAVEDLSNWKFVAQTDQPVLCNNESNDRACEIVVSSDFLTDPEEMEEDSPLDQFATESLDIVQGGSSIYYVDQLQSDVEEAFNAINE